MQEVSQISWHPLNTTWDTEQADIRAVRTRVFIDEQGIPGAEEWDDRDAVCLHALVRAADGTAIATARLDTDGRIGRMAVLPAWRGKGVGTTLLRHLIREARQRGLAACHLHAQSQAVSFYHQHGFVVEGDEFFEAGIAHRRMILRL